MINDFAGPDVVLMTRSGVPLTPSAEILANLFIREAASLYISGNGDAVDPGA